MKRSVSKEAKVTFAIGLVAWVVAQMVHAEETEFIALICVGFATYLAFDTPPPWLRHSPLGRWLRR
jgi:hypothetical protein